MDYYGTKFEFDLQLFAAANVTVNLTTADTSAAATQYLVGTTWYTSVAEIPEEDRGSIIATLKSKVLTVAVGTEATGNAVTVTAADADALEGYEVKTVNSFSETGAAATSSAAVSEVGFKDSSSNSLGSVGDVSTGASTSAASTIVFDADTASQATVSEGCTVNDMTATDGAAVFTLAATDDAQSLVSGKVTVAASAASFKVGDNTYANVSKDGEDEATTATITATYEESATTATLTSGTLQLAAGSSVTASDTAGTTVTAKTGTVTVDNEGVIGEFENDDVFAVSDGGSAVTTYTVAVTANTSEATKADAATITASGNYSGVYVLTAGGEITLENIKEKVTITPVAGSPDTVTDGNATTETKTVSPAAWADNEKLTLVAATAVNTPQYYKVTVNANNKLEIADSADSSAPTSGCIGYFTVTTSNEYNTPTATVTYSSLTGSTATANAQLLINVPVDFTALTAVATDGAAITTVNVSGLTTGTTTVTGLAQSVTTVDVDTDASSYVEGAALADGTTITLPADMSAENLYFYVTKSAEPDDRNVYTYTVSTAKTATPSGDDANKSYFTWTRSSGALTFTAGSLGPAGLTADCWDGVTIDATAVTTASTKLDVTGLDAATFAVTAKVGFTVTGADDSTKNVTATWSDAATNATVTYKYNDGSNDVESISMPTSNTTEKWVVTYENVDGNPTYTFTKTASPESGAAYISVTKAETAYTVTYEPGTAGIALTGVTNPKSSATDKTMRVAIAAADGATSITVADGADGAATNFDCALTNVPAGLTVTGTTSGDTVSYTAAWLNAIEIDLAEMAETGETVYYAVKAGEQDTSTGYRTVTLGDKIETTPTTEQNYYSIEETSGTYTIKYVKATTGDGDKIDLAATTTSGNTTINAEDIASTATINVYTKDTVIGATAVTSAAAGITVNAKDSGGTSESGSGTVATTYINTYAVAYNSSDTALNLTGDATYYWTVTKSDTKGAITYTFGEGTTTQPTAANTSYIKATVDANKKLTLTLNVVGTGVTEAELAKLGTTAIKINAAGIATTTTAIDLSDSSIDTVNFAVSGIPKTVTTTTAGSSGDTFEYTKTYTMGTANKLTLGSTAGTEYFAVTATGGDLGVYTISISDTAIDLSAADGDADKIAEILGGVGNYFIVTTAEDASNNNVSVKYHPATGTKAIALTGTDSVTTSGLVVKVDASGMNDAGELAFDDATAKVSTYDVTGLVGTNGGTTVSGATTVNKAYEETYSITSNMSFADFASSSITASGENSILYYNVADRTGGDTSARGVWTYAVGNAQTTTSGLGSHYFKVTWASDYGIVITYINGDGDADYNLASTGESVSYNAATLPATVDTIDITDTATNAAVNYALTGVPATVTTVKGQLDGDTVTYAATAVLADDQQITLADAAVQYFVVGGTQTAATVTASETQPEDTANYFTVTRSGSAGAYTYTMAYHPSVGGTAFNLGATTSGTLEIAAGALPTGSTLALANDSARYANLEVTGAKGGLALSGNNSTTPADTIAYSTEFAWAAGTYYIEKASTGNTTVVAGASADITKADSTKTYVQVTVTVDSEGAYTVASDTNGFAPNASTGVMTEGSAHDAAVVLEAPATTGWTANVSNYGFSEITNVPKDAVLTNVATTTQVTTAELAKGESFTMTPQNGSAATYTSGGGAISVTNTAAISGTFLLSDATLSGTATGTDWKTATVDGDVLVTFTDGAITSITGLEADETLTLVTGAGGDANTFTYTYDGTNITKTAKDGSSVTYAATTSTTADILALGYYAAGEITEVGDFKWVDGTYYVKAASASGEAAVAYTTEKAAVADGTYYIKAVYASSSTPSLTLSAYKGNSAGLLDPATDFTGTVNVTADGSQAIKYVKASTDGFTVNFAGVANGSSFTALSDTDTVTTGTLAAANTVTFVSADTTPVTTVYTANAAGALEFVGSALKNGTVKVSSTANCTTAYTTDGSTIVASGTSPEVEITVVGGEISTIKNLGSNETITVTEADGTVTTFTGTSATSVTKTVTTASGDQTQTTLTIETDADVWGATGGTVSYVNDFAWSDGKAGYFKYGKTTANQADVPSSTDTSTLTLTEGDTYARASVAVDATTSVKTLTIVSYIVKDGELVQADTGATMGKTVEITPPTGAVLEYDGSGNDFKVVFKAADAGSVFENLNTGDVVTTDALAATEKVTVNGTAYTAPTGGTTFTVYSESTTASRIVAGAVVLDEDTPSVNASTSDGLTKRTVTYVPGTDSTATYDGVTATFAAGDASSIVGIEAGASITVATTTSSGTATTIYEAVKDASDANKVYIYKTASGATTYTATSITAASGNVIGTFTSTATSEMDAFAWADAVDTTNAVGYFLIDSETKAVTAADQTAKVTTDYTQYGNTYLVATYQADGALTFQKATVGASGELGTATALGGSDALEMTLTVTGAKKLSFDRNAVSGAISALTITGAGADTSITNWTTADSITTAALAEGETITLGSTTYTSGAASNALEVDGTNLVNGTFRLSSSTPVNATYTDSSNTVTATTVTFTPGTGAAADVTFEDGIVQSVTGLGGGETIQIAVTTTDKLGNVTTSDYTYAATEVASGAKAGQIEVTRTDNVTGEKTTHTFTSEKQDILGSTVSWIASGSAAVSNFDWNTTAAGATGYFLATATDSTNKKFTVATIEAQSSAALSENYYLKVTASKDTTGLVTITGMELVKRDSAGLYTSVTGTVTTAVAVTAPASTNLAFTANTIPMAITAQANQTYTGLDEDDTLTVSFTQTSDKVTVNGKTYNSGVSSAADIVIDGDGAVRSGALTVGTTAMTDEAGSTIVATKGDAVVSFTAYDAAAETGGISGVTGLTAGESLTLTGADGTVTTWTVTDNTTTSNDDVVRTITANGITETWKITVTDNAEIFPMTGYTPANTFDFGASSTGKVGYFSITSNTASVAKGSDSSTAIAGNGEYVRVVATTDDEGAVTITSLKELKYDASAGAFEVVDNSGDTITIVSQGSTTIASGAIVLPDEDTSRDFKLAVTGAKAGETYEGFGDSDTVAATGLLVGETLTVGGVTYTAGQTTDAILYGDGTAQAGTFALASGKTLTGKVVGTDATTVVGTTGTDAQVTFAAGAVSGIYGLTDGESVTVTTTTSAGAVTKSTYTASGTDTLTITKVTVADGVTTTATFVGATESANVVTLSYTEPTATIKSQFDWTAQTGAGYFEVTPTLENGKVTDIGTVTIETQPKAITAEKGSYYLKVALDADGSINTTNGITLVQVQDDGTLGENLLTTTTTGTITITAPTAKALTFDKSGSTLNAATVAITGAIDDSTITNLAAGDTVTTATLAAPVTDTAGNVTYETVSVGGTADGSAVALSAGAATTMKFAVTSGGKAVLSTGTVILQGVALSGTKSFKTTGANDTTGTTATETDDITVTFTQDSASATDAPIITVKNGQITAVSGVKTGSSSLVVADPATATSTYTAGAVAITGLASGAKLTTAALDANTAVNCGTLSFTMAEAGQAIIQNETTTPTLTSGTILLTQTTSAIALTGATTATTDTKTVSFTRSTADTLYPVTVKVQNGVITSIKGLKANDVLVYGDTTYTAVTDTHITKTVDGTTSHAYITAQGEIYTASYVGDGGEVTSDNPLEGQLSWNDTSGRATGYFAIKETSAGVKTATIAEQASKVAVAIPKAGVTAKYLVANVTNGELSISGMTVTTDSSGTTTTATLDTTASANFSSADTITITAPTTAITYDKDGALFAIAVNKLAAYSTIANLAKGDKVVTNTLAIGETVTVGGQTYAAGAKNALTIVGETNTTATTRTAALMSGTIRLNSTYASAVLAGTKDATIVETDDVTVSFDDNSGAATENVMVKVANGAVTSVTGLVTQGATVTVLGATEAEVYTVLDTAGTMIQRQTFAVSEGEITGSATATAFKTVAAGKEIYAATGRGYTEAVQTEASTLTDWTTAGSKVAYIALDSLGAAKKLTSTAAKTAQSGDVTTEAFYATPEAYYLKVSATTAANGVTTIKNVELMQAGATGKLAAVKSTAIPYYGELTIDGATATSTANADDAKIAYALPVYGTKRYWTLNAENVAVGSVFTNIGANDQITSAAITELTDFAKGTYVLYNANGTGTNTQTVKITGDGVKLTESAGAVTGLTGLYTKGETVTLTTETLAGGESTVVYKVTEAGTVERTTTAVNGTMEVRTITGVTEATNMFSAETIALFDAADASGFQIVSNFDWTMANSTTTYAAIKSAAATVKAGKVSVTSRNVNAAGYIALAIEADGRVESIKQVSFNATTGVITEADEGAFTGTINITAPTAKAFTFDRSTALNTDNDSIGDDAQIVITGAVANSTIAGLAAGDSVTTAALAKAATIGVNGATFTAVSGGKLVFTAQEVDEKAQITLTGGTIALAYSDGETEGVDFAYVGDTLITATKGGVNVTASTTAKGVTSFTIADLGEGETFTVETFGAGAQTATYMKSGTTLFRTIAGEEGTSVYTIGSKTSVTSAILDKSTNWTAVQETFTTDTETDMKTLVSGGAVTVDLAALDKRIAADNKAGVLGTEGDTTAYDFVVDTYLAKAQSKNANLAASVIADANLLSVQTSVGSRAALTYTYDAAADVAQTIKAATGWTVNGSGGADSITGAAKGYDTLVGNAGDDTLTGGAAEDTFYVGHGTDVLKSYTTAKDTVFFDIDSNLTGDTFRVELNGTATEGTKKLTGVRLYADTNGDGVYSAEDDTNSVLLVGMGNKKAVEVNGATYYFGSGTATKAETFTYDEGAYYYGKENLDNAVSVGTDKTKATAKTLGDTVSIDLNAQDDNGVSYYNNITIVDASKSGNSVKLTALAETDTTLKGGTYTSTLVGGTGNDSMVGGSGTDVFWFDNLAGSDTISGYASAKNDAVYLGDWDGESTAANVANGVTVQGAANNKDVILTNGTDTVSLTGALGAAKAVKISTDGTTANTLSYYVGAAGTSKKAASNTFTATIGTDVTVTTAGEGTTEDPYDTSVSMKSYYLGNDSATDTLKLATKDKKATVGTSTSDYATFSIEGTHFQSIDVLDASGLAAGSYVELVGKESGTFTLKGSTSTQSMEKFNLTGMVTSKLATTEATIQNLSVSDVIELGTGLTLSAQTKGSNTIYTIYDGSDNCGTLTVSGVKEANLSYSSTTGKLTRTK